MQLLVLILSLFLRILSSDGWQEKLVCIRELNEKNILEFKKKIDVRPGLLCTTYCPEYQIVVIKLNREFHADDRDLCNILKQLGYLEFDLKEGANSRQLIDNCPQTINLEP